MFVEERQQRILERLRQQGKVTVEELVGAFGVSAPTVRADLAALEAQHLLRRTHGGEVQARRRALLGPLSVDFLRPFRADWLFMGVNGIDPVAGLTVADFEVAQVKRAMIAAAGTTVIVADSGKVERVAFAHVAPLS